MRRPVREVIDHFEPRPIAAQQVCSGCLKIDKLLSFLASSICELHGSGKLPRNDSATCETNGAKRLCRFYMLRKKETKAYSEGAAKHVRLDIQWLAEGWQRMV